jgi:hypothetical protein
MVLPGNVCRVRDRPFFKQTALSSGSGEAPSSLHLHLRHHRPAFRILRGEHAASLDINSLVSS